MDEKRLIAYFDILGFRNLIRQKEYSEIRNVLSCFVDEAKQTERWNSDFGVIAFSDTVVIYQKASGMDQTCWWDMVFFARKLFITMLRHKIPMRCVINYDEFFVDQAAESSAEIYWGKALVAAHEAESTENIVGIFILPHAVCIGADKPIKNLQMAYPDDFHVKFDDRVFVNPFERISRINASDSIRDAVMAADPEILYDIDAYFNLKKMAEDVPLGKDRDKYTNSLKLAALFLENRETSEGTRLEEMNRILADFSEYQVILDNLENCLLK